MSARNRVLFISPQPFFQWRGSPIRVGFDAQALVDAGFDVDLLVLPFGDDRVIKGVDIIRAANPFGVRDVAIGPSFAKACFDLLLLMKAFQLQGRRRYCAVHCVEDAGLIGAALSMVYGVRFVFEKHSDPSSYRKGWLRNFVMFLYGRIERFCLRRADAVICTGSGLAAQARAAGGRGTVFDICDIPSSLRDADAGEAGRIRQKWALPPGAVVAAYVGSFAVYQGVDLLFDAFARAHQSAGNLRLLVVGGTREEIARRKVRLRDLGCGESVIFAGKIQPDDLPPYLEAADILVSPRVSGVNTPLKLLDYLKAGRPVLATDTEANRLILDESTAVFAAVDAVELGDKLCQLAGNAELRSGMGRAGRELIDRKYNYAMFSGMIRDVYRGLGLENSN